MNSLNYCSLKVSQKLVESGIVLETDFYWFAPSGCKEEWCITSTAHDKEYSKYVPAPSMAELWRELPETLDVVDVMKPHSYIRMTKFQGETVTGYGCQLDVGKRINPSDSLADLLIWVKKENVF